MKLETFSNLYFVVSVLVPGFIYRGVVSNFVPLKQHKDREQVLLGFLTATAINYAVCSPLIYLLAFGVIFPKQPAGQALCWFAVIFIAPAILGMLNAWIIQKDGLGWLYHLLRLRSINPIPTGWDFIFSTTAPCYVLITLTDGTEIAGYFGSQSMASSDPERKDIYIERVYKVPEGGKPWEEVERSLGMHTDGSQIAYIEFRSETNHGQSGQRTPTDDGYKPITEGYQPGNVLQKGYTPAATTTSTPQTPPSGGSSAVKPTQTSSSASSSQKS